MNARRRRAGLPRSGSRVRIRTHEQCNPSLVFKSSKYFIYFKYLRLISFRTQCFSTTLQRALFTAPHARCGNVFCARVVCESPGVHNAEGKLRFPIASSSKEIIITSICLAWLTDGYCHHRGCTPRAVKVVLSPTWGGEI